MMGHTLRAGPAAAGRLLVTSLHEFGHRPPEPLRQPAQHAQCGIVPAELDPRQLAAAYVGFSGERLLAQPTRRSQPLELLRQGVHAGAIVTNLAQPVKRTIAPFYGQSWPIALPRPIV